jgi:hypothetical protein
MKFPRRELCAKTLAMELRIIKTDEQYRRSLDEARRPVTRNSR